MRALPLLLCWWLATVAAAPASADDALFALINERLGLMRDVALHKWQSNLPIEDLTREAVVIRAARRNAVAHGIDGDGAARFFAAQIDAAKAIQRHWFRQWSNNEPEGNAPDLVTELRPRLLELGDAIVAGLHAVADNPANRAAFSAALTTTGLGPGNHGALFTSLSSIERHSSTLARIATTGELRVGTTGDYAPFTHAAGGDTPVGIDIEQARDLANALKARVRFVQTSWPTLMDDVLDGQFDIAMGGISRSVARARLARFSEPYLTDGKTAIVRCEDAGRFDSVAAVDQPGVRVIVNPGGTNQRFVSANINHATVEVWPDNRTIFAEIAAGRADVMFTDGIEVRLQRARLPKLCGSMPPQTYLEKAYLLPRIDRDEAWLETVNVWLGLRVGSGAVDALVSRHTEQKASDI